MSDSRTAVGFDRLPWLKDEPPPRRKSGRGDLAAWALAATVLVAGASYWMGTQSGEVQAPPTNNHRSTATVPLPQPRAVTASPEVRLEPQPEVRLESAPELRPARVAEIRTGPPTQAVTVHASGRAQDIKDREAATTQQSGASATPNQTAGAASPQPLPFAVQAPPRPGPAQTYVLKPWPPRMTKGAAGRLVQIGAFGTRLQAKRGWWYMAREYPAMQGLPAIVVATRNSHGRVFYRFQVGTTSQAHSEVLCQRMQKIRLSCAVVGLPWKAKVER